MTGTTSANSGPPVSTDLADRETSCPAQLHRALAGGRVLLGLRRVGLVATPPHATKNSAPKCRRATTTGGRGPWPWWAQGCWQLHRMLPEAPHPRVAGQ